MHFLLVPRTADAARAHAWRTRRVPTHYGGRARGGGERLRFASRRASAACDTYPSSARARCSVDARRARCYCSRAGPQGMVPECNVPTSACPKNAPSMDSSPPRDVSESLNSAHYVSPPSRVWQTAVHKLDAVDNNELASVGNAGRRVSSHYPKACSDPADTPALGSARASAAPAMEDTTAADERASARIAALFSHWWNGCRLMDFGKRRSCGIKPASMFKGCERHVSFAPFLLQTNRSSASVVLVRGLSRVRQQRRTSARGLTRRRHPARAARRAETGAHSHFHLHHIHHPRFYIGEYIDKHARGARAGGQSMPRTRMPQRKCGACDGRHHGGGRARKSRIAAPSGHWWNDPSTTRERGSRPQRSLRLSPTLALVNNAPARPELHAAAASRMQLVGWRLAPTPTPTLTSATSTVTSTIHPRFHVRKCMHNQAGGWGSGCARQQRPRASARPQLVGRRPAPTSTSVSTASSTPASTSANASTSTRAVPVRAGRVVCGDEGVEEGVCAGFAPPRRDGDRMALVKNAPARIAPPPRARSSSGGGRRPPPPPCPPHPQHAGDARAGGVACGGDWVEGVGEDLGAVFATPRTVVGIGIGMGDMWQGWGG
ncbi:hypothetical protein DFH06DRAFT_1147544 [Mycena polygramma]|nr:hypothetical protein DFH06DRAFT_1147544 [Mycena polygramma]